MAQRQLDAYNAHDLEAFLLCYAEDVEVRRLPGGESIAAGRAGMRKVYGDLFASRPGRRADLLARMECGRFCVDHERVSDGPGTPDRFAVAIYECEGGWIRRVWFPPVAEEGPGGA
ncbi:MAG: nuclear transport factor 2 family protein [Planctomycetaceae bacterium]|nr:nuclear transport factor 2 family protein [Planctomycetaceae bacterium]